MKRRTFQKETTHGMLRIKQNRSAYQFKCVCVCTHACMCLVEVGVAKDKAEKGSRFVQVCSCELFYRFWTMSQ